METAFYILVGTIAWLLFRRILYYPLWLLVWIPIKLVYRLTLVMMSAAGIPGAALELAQLSSSSSALSSSATSAIPTIFPGEPLVTGTGQYEEPSPPVQSDNETMIEQIGRMVDESTKQQEPTASYEGTNVDDITPEERKRQEEMPRNPKKRMYEEEWKDEL